MPFGMERKLTIIKCKSNKIQGSENLIKTK